MKNELLKKKRNKDVGSEFRGAELGFFLFFLGSHFWERCSCHCFTPAAGRGESCEVRIGSDSLPHDSGRSHSDEAERTHHKQFWKVERNREIREYIENTEFSSSDLPITCQMAAALAQGPASEALEQWEASCFLPGSAGCKFGELKGAGFEHDKLILPHSRFTVCTVPCRRQSILSPACQRVESPALSNSRPFPQRVCGFFVLPTSLRPECLHALHQPSGVSRVTGWMWWILAMRLEVNRRRPRTQSNETNGWSSDVLKLRFCYGIIIYDGKHSLRKFWKLVFCLSCISVCLFYM